jgi:molybdopterin/thiamine biosynthesis adenylyltransferase/rhodanese-related sulfurtransferase
MWHPFAVFAVLLAEFSRNGGSVAESARQCENRRMDAARFARQLVLPGFGAQAQGKLADARVLVIGAGGLGSAVIPALAAAGVGTLAIVDDDRVESSNLPRQIIHRAEDVGRRKVDSAAERVAALSPDTNVIRIAERIDVVNALELIEEYDLVVDGSDTFETRYLVNDAAVLVDRPVVWGSVSQYGGQVGLSWAERGPQYRDLFPVEPSDADALTCELGGVLPTVVATVGSLMATEAIKVLTGIGEPLLGRVIVLDALGATFEEVRYQRAPDREREPNATRTPKPEGATPIGTRSPAPVRKGIGNGLLDADHATLRPPDTNWTDDTMNEAEPPIVDPERSPDISPAEAAALDGHVLLDVREPWEVELVGLDGAVNIPLGQLADRVGELDPTVPVVAFCHHGTRSERARQFLEANGFDVRNLTGGIDAWARDIEPELRRY